MPTNDLHHRRSIRRPRVCYLIGGKEGGGMAVATRDLILHVSRDRFEVFVASCGDGPFVEKLAADGIECHILGTGWPPSLRRNVEGGVMFERGGPLRLARWLLTTSRAFAGFLGSHDVNLVHSNYYHFHAVAALACPSAGAKCVLHWRARIDHPFRVVGPQPGSARMMPMAPRWKWMIRAGPLLRAMMGDDVWSVSVSRAVAESVGPLVGNRHSVIHDGIEIAPRRQASDDTLRELLRIPPTSPVVGMVCTFNPIKGHMHFIEAAATVFPQIPDVHFVHIGGETAAGQAAYRETLFRRVRELKLTDRFHFLGHRDDVVRLTSQFDVAVSCALPPGEGFGLTLLEAMALGVPVVAPDCGGPKEIIVSGESGLLVSPADSRALADAILALLCDSSLRRRLGSAGRERYERHFTIERCARQIESLYHSLLNQP